MDTRMYWGLLVMVLASASPLHAQTPIYRCTVDGVVTFTDRACNEGAVPVTLDTSRVSTFAPVPAGKVETPKAQRRRTARAEPIDKPEDRCVSIRSALRKVDEQLRAGYSAKQGVRLEQRKRDLRARAREMKCR